MFRVLDSDEIKFIVGRPVEKSLEDLVDIVINPIGVSALPVYDGKVWFSTRETYVDDGKVIVFMPLVFYTTLRKYTKYILYPGLELKNDLSNTPYTSVIRLLNEEGNPNPILKAIYELWSDVIR